MEKTLVSEKKLLCFLNVELQQNGQHENCRYGSIIQMKIDGRMGCNWSSATLQYRTYGTWNAQTFAIADGLCHRRLGLYRGFTVFGCV